MDSNFRFRAISDYAGVGVALHLGSLTLRRRGPNWNATKRRRDSERRASTAAESLRLQRPARRNLNLARSSV